MPVGKKSIARLTKTASEMKEPKVTGIVVTAPEVPAGDPAVAVPPARKTKKSAPKTAERKTAAKKTEGKATRKSEAVTKAAESSSYAIGSLLPYWLL